MFFTTSLTRSMFRPISCPARLHRQVLPGRRAFHGNAHQRPDFGRHHRESLALVARVSRFHRGIQRQEVVLKRDLVRQSVADGGGGDRGKEVEVQFLR
jgi:hypothetical protein